MPRPYIPIPKEITDKAVQAFKDGLTQGQILQELKIKDGKKLRKTLLDNGITEDQLRKRGREAIWASRINSSRIDQATAKLVMEDFAEGKTQQEISTKHTIPTTRIRSTLIEGGITEEQLLSRRNDNPRRRANAKWKVGDRNFHVEIIKIFRKEITRRNGTKYVVTMSDVKCDCGTKKTIYLANFTRTKSCSTTCWHTYHDSPSKQDLTNRWFGSLWVLKEGPKEILNSLVAKPGRTTYFVYCQCCNRNIDRPVRASALTSGNTTRCGDCRTNQDEKEKIDLLNQQFGSLLVLREWGNKKPEKRKHGERLWLCRCEGCGSTQPYQQNNLRSGNSRQCVSCSGQFKDNLDIFLSDENHAEQPCFYYIASIENGRYFKPGIAENLEGRQRTSKGKYTGYYFKSDTLSRAEAWTIEQLVLDACYSARPKTLDSSFTDWAGASELRSPHKVSLEMLKSYTKAATQETLKTGWRQIWLSRWKLTKQNHE